MVVKREDCVFVIDDDERIVGIFIVKDFVFCVVGVGLKVVNVIIVEIMIKNFFCVRIDISVIDVFDFMVCKGFCYLLVMDEN